MVFTCGSYCTVRIANEYVTIGAKENLGATQEQTEKPA